MKYRLVKKRPFRIVGFKKEVEVVLEGTNPSIEAMQDLLTDEVKERLNELANTEPSGLMSVSLATQASDGANDTIIHYIGVATTKSDIQHFDVLDIGRTQWVVFSSQDASAESLEAMWHTIFKEWLPDVFYVIDETIPLLWSTTESEEDLANYNCEVWLPIKRSV